MQQWFAESLCVINPETTVCFIVDIMIVPRSVPESQISFSTGDFRMALHRPLTLNIVSLGELQKLRPSNSQSFTDEEMGHLASMLRELIVYQKRAEPVANGYLTNGVVIMYMRVILQQSSVDTIEYSSTLPLSRRVAKGHSHSMIFSTPPCTL